MKKEAEGGAKGARRNEAKSHDNNANLRLMKEDDWKTKLNELHLWEPRVGEWTNWTGLQSGTATGDCGLGNATTNP